MVGQAPVRVADIGYAKDAQQIQTNIVRVDGQRSVYVPVLKQGGDTNTIAVVDGIKDAVSIWSTCPRSWSREVVFDQSVFVKTAIETLLHEGGIGLFLTSIMILVFLGSMRATVAVFFSIPLSALATFIALSMGGGSINSMVLGGLALAFSRLIDNSVVVLENIYRHLELGEEPAVAAEKGGREVALPVLAATLDHGGRVLPGDVPVRRQQVPVLRAGAGGGALAVRVLCRRDDGGAAVLRAIHQGAARITARRQSSVSKTDHVATRSANGFNVWFNDRFECFCGSTTSLVGSYADASGGYAACRSRGVRLQSLDCSLPRPLLLPAHRCRPVRDQSEGSERHAAFGYRERSRQGRRRLVRQVVSPEDLGMIVSNIGVTPDFSAIYTTNSGMHTAFVQVSLKEDHKIGSYEYMAACRRKLARRAAGADGLLPIRRPGGRGAEPRPARANRCAGGRQ